MKIHSIEHLQSKFVVECHVYYNVIFDIKQLGIMMYKRQERLILQREHKRLLLHHKKYNQKKDGEGE